MPLTDAKCRSAQPAPRLQKLTDGGGLQPTGARLWRLAYRFDGKQKPLALGVYPAVSLARARQAREDARRRLAEGLGSGAREKAPGQADAPTFAASPTSMPTRLRREPRSEATMAKIEWLLGFANAEFGDEPIGRISTPEALDDALARREERVLSKGADERHIPAHPSNSSLPP
jgi:hypothetical protein